MYDNSNLRRRSSRLEKNTVILCSKCIIDGKVNVFKPPKELKVLNVSNEGLCVTATEAFKEGSLIKFDIMLEDTTYKSMFAKIIWNIRIDDNYKYGLNIQNISGKFSRHIYELENRVSTTI